MRRFIIMLVVAAGVGAAFNSCTGNGVASGLECNESVELATYSDTAIVALPPSDDMLPGSEYVKMATSGVFPVSWGGRDIKALQDSLMSIAYGTHGVTLREAIRYYHEHPVFADESGVTATVTKPGEVADTCISEQVADITVVSMSTSVLSFAVSSYYYAWGAAHGMYGTTYLNYYLPANAILTPEIIFEPSARKDIIEAIRSAAREQYSTVNTMVDPDEIEEYDNFLIKPEGLTFVYAPYEIAPYAAGEVSVSVAPYQLYDYLTPLGKEVFGF